LIRATLSVLLSDAVDTGVILANPAVGIARRGRKRADTVTVQDRQSNIRPMAYEQLATFLKAAHAARSHRDATLFLLLADAGLRPGEALALRWEDFDAAARSLRVARAVYA
jgi:integrase